MSSETGRHEHRTPKIATYSPDGTERGDHIGHDTKQGHSIGNAPYSVCCARFYDYLNRRREYDESVYVDGQAECRGEYAGDGIPRTAGGFPFEPLDWGKVIQI